MTGRPISIKVSFNRFHIRSHLSRSLRLYSEWVVIRFVSTNHSSAPRAARMSGLFAAGSAGMISTSVQPFRFHSSAISISNSVESGCDFGLLTRKSALASIPFTVRSRSSSLPKRLKIGSTRAAWFTSVRRGSCWDVSTR